MGNQRLGSPPEKSTYRGYRRLGGRDFQKNRYDPQNCFFPLVFHRWGTISPLGRKMSRSKADLGGVEILFFLAKSDLGSRLELGNEISTCKHLTRGRPQARPVASESDKYLHSMLPAFEFVLILKTEACIRSIIKTPEDLVSQPGQLTKCLRAANPNLSALCQLSLRCLHFDSRDEHRLSRRVSLSLPDTFCLTCCACFRNRTTGMSV